MDIHYNDLSLKGKLSHRESILLLLLTEGLLSSLFITTMKNLYLFLGKSTAHSTGLLDAEISRNVLSVGIVFLKLRDEKVLQTSYSSSLLLAQDSKSTSDVLADNLDLSKLSRSSTSNLGNTELYDKTK